MVQRVHDDLEELLPRGRLTAVPGHQLLPTPSAATPARTRSPHQRTRPALRSYPLGSPCRQPCPSRCASMFASNADSCVMLIRASPRYPAARRRHVHLTSHRRRDQRLLVLAQQFDRSLEPSVDGSSPSISHRRSSSKSALLLRCRNSHDEAFEHLIVDDLAALRAGADRSSYFAQVRPADVAGIVA